MKDNTLIFSVQNTNNHYLGCSSGDEKNHRLVNGTLSLVAIKENYFAKNYTTGHIISRKQFKFGKIDIRASIPLNRSYVSHLLIQGFSVRLYRLSQK